MFFFSWFKWLLMKSVEQKNYIFLTSSKIEFVLINVYMLFHEIIYLNYETDCTQIDEKEV